MYDADIHNLISDVYEAASAPERWGPIVKGIRSLTRSHYGKLWFGSTDHSALEHATRAGDFLAFEHPDLSLTDFGNFVQSLPESSSSSFTEPYATRVSGLPIDRVLNGHDLVPISEFRKSEWFHLVAKRLGMVHTIGAVMGWQNNQVYGLTFYRKDDGPNYGRVRTAIVRSVYSPRPLLIDLVLPAEIGRRQSTLSSKLD